MSSFKLVRCWGSEERIIFQNFSFLANFYENCLVVEFGLYNLSKIENIIMLFASLILYDWLYIIGFKSMFT